MYQHYRQMNAENPFYFLYNVFAFIGLRVQVCTYRNGILMFSNLNNQIFFFMSNNIFGMYRICIQKYPMRTGYNYLSVTYVALILVYIFPWLFINANMILCYHYIHAVGINSTLLFHFRCQAQ